MAQNNVKLHCTAASPESATVKSMNKQTLKKVTNSAVNIVENYIIIWLDQSLDFSHEENREFRSRLRSIVNSVETFTDTIQCLQYLSEVKDEKVFLIISDTFSNQIASFEEKFTQLNSIFILCQGKTKAISNDSIKAYRKGKGIFVHTNQLCTELEKNIRQLNNGLTPSSIIATSSTANLNDLDPSFMYCQLLTENFFTINYGRNSIDELAEYCRPFYEGNTFESNLIDQFQSQYQHNSAQESAIRWYTNECFLYKMLNKALRTLEIETLMKMSVFIRDLHEQLRELHLKIQPKQIPPKVFRGQGIAKAEFNNWKKSEGALWSCNSFLSTSEKEQPALNFASGARGSETEGVLFEITIDPSIQSVSFAPVKDLSHFAGEEEILFSIGAVFRIGAMEEIDRNLWRVSLTLTNDRDPVLKRITGHIRTSLGDGNGWRQLGQLMIKMGKHRKAKEIYEKLMEHVDPKDPAELTFLHNQLGYAEKQMENLSAAAEHYKQSLDISAKYMSIDDPRLSSTYSNIGAIWKKLKYFEDALKCFELVLKIDLAKSVPNRLEIAIDYNNIGSVLDDQGKYLDALKNYHEALAIKLAHLPPNHPSLASNYSNIGVVHRKMGDCSTALVNYKKALEIQEKSLQPNHPSLIAIHGNIATALETLGRYDQAIEHAQKASKIAEHALGSTHPETIRRSNFLTELRQRL